MAPRDDEASLPSDAELKLLRELWRQGEQSVGALHDRVQDAWPVGCTTVLKLLQRTLEKDRVERRREGRGHLDRPAVYVIGADGTDVRRLFPG